MGTFGWVLPLKKALLMLITHAQQAPNMCAKCLTHPRSTLHSALTPPTTWIIT